MDKGDIEGILPSGQSSNLEQMPKQWEEIVYLLDDVVEGQEKAEKSRRAKEKAVLDEISELKKKEKKISKLEEENRGLRIENESLHDRLDEFQESVPWPVYAVTFVGILLLIYSSFFVVDLIYPLMGIGMLVISVTAFIESKFKGNRTR